MALLCAASACSFDPTGARGGGVGPGDDGGMTGDGGPIDATPGVECTAGERLCAGHAIETCNEAGDGYVAAEREVCPLSCEPGGGDDPFCTAPSNIAAAEAAACDGGSTLAPTSGTVTIRSLGDVEVIECDPDCGGDESMIERAGIVEQGATDIAWFCLSEVSLPAGVNIVVSTSVTRSIAFLVDGNVSIDGTVAIQGRAGVAGDGDITASALGRGGPGGFDGGAPTAVDADGNAGRGACGGEPGQIASGNGGPAGSGGGGGGHAAVGGDGGDGKSNGSGGDEDDGTVIAGGAGGSAACAAPALTPLLGGAGGGSGGDGGDCGAACGWPGGGGGGALQISARGDLSITGSVAAGGGAGAQMVLPVNFARGGAGGGGAGGSVLLEASRLLLADALISVVGGRGGSAGAGPGGDGGGVGLEVNMLTGQSVGQTPEDGQGGAGGGGAAGRVRLNAVNEPTCGAIVLPPVACSSGLLAQP